MKSSSVQLIVLGLVLAAVSSQFSQSQSSGQPSHETTAAASVPDAGTINKAHDDSFIIGNDDVLAISVWKEPDLTKSLPVRSDGKISLPLVGEMQAAGHTPLQLEHEITEKLKSYITAPEVSVIVEKINSKKFNILGEVAKPGSYPVTATTTIVDAIAAAGGFRDFAKKSGVYVLRKTPDGQQKKLSFNYKDFIKGKNANQNINLEPNDTVVVP